MNALWNCGMPGRTPCTGRMFIGARIARKCFSRVEGKVKNMTTCARCGHLKRFHVVLWGKVMCVCPVQTMEADGVGWVRWDGCEEPLPNPKPKKRRKK